MGVIGSTVDFVEGWCVTESPRVRVVATRRKFPISRHLTSSILPHTLPPHTPRHSPCSRTPSSFILHPSPLPFARWRHFLTFSCTSCYIRTFPQALDLSYNRLERQRKTLLAHHVPKARTSYICTQLRIWQKLKKKKHDIACMHVLRSTYLPSYSSLIRCPYTSDPFPVAQTPSSDACAPLN